MTIGTKIHEALQTRPDHPALKGMTRLPHFVIDPEISYLFRSGQAQQSVWAMFEADVAKLPYPALLVEMFTGKPWRYFIQIVEAPEPSSFLVTLVEYVNGAIWPNDFLAQFTFAGGGNNGNDRPIWKIVYNDKKRDDLNRQGAAAIMIALLMSHTSGLERETIEPNKLNKARKRNGKSQIPTHVIIRIGHVYDRDGKRVAINESNRRSISIHMRAGHTRRQHYGPQNSQTKIVWIPPVLVNYKDGSELPLPKPRLVKL